MFFKPLLCPMRILVRVPTFLLSNSSYTLIFLLRTAVVNNFDLRQPSTVYSTLFFFLILKSILVGAQMSPPSFLLQTSWIPFMPVHKPFRFFLWHSTVCAIYAKVVRIFYLPKCDPSALIAFD